VLYRRTRVLLPPGVTFGGSFGMNRTSMMATRKRRLAAPEQTACTPNAVDAQETPFASSLQAVLTFKLPE